MSVLRAVQQPAAVDHSIATQLRAGDAVVVRVLQELTHERATEKIVCKVEGVIYKSARVDVIILRVPPHYTPSEYENTRAFKVYDELPDNPGMLILRRYGAG